MWLLNNSVSGFIEFQELKKDQKELNSDVFMKWYWNNDLWQLKHIFHIWKPTIASKQEQNCYNKQDKMHIYVFQTVIDLEPYIVLIICLWDNIAKCSHIC